jgi:hypothetical protein
LWPLLPKAAHIFMMWMLFAALEGMMEPATYTSLRRATESPDAGDSHF